MVALLLATGCATVPYSHGLSRVGGESPAAVVVLERHFGEGRYAGDVDVVAQQVSLQGHPLWNGNQSGAYTVSMPVATSEFSELRPVAVPDGRGGTFVAYEVRANDGLASESTRIWAQHLNADGHATWHEGVRSVEVGASPGFVARDPVLVPDNRGGLLVVYEVEFTEGEHTGDVDIMAQRVNRSGLRMWGQGILVASSKMIERSPVAVSDGRGGAHVVYEAEARDGEYAGDSEILAQRISRRGRLLFHGGARSLVVSAGRVGERSPVAVPDGRGGVITLFEQHVEDGPLAGRVWIAGQRISRGGRLVWNGGQRSTAVSLGPFVHSGLQAVSDQHGGAIAVFDGVLAESDETVSSEVFAQRVDRAGRLLYGQGGQAALVASSPLEETAPQVVSDGSGGAVVVFQQHGLDETLADVAAQRLDPAGRPIWGKAGQHSVTLAQQIQSDRPLVVASDGQGGALVFYEQRLDDVAILDHAVIKGQRIDANGRPIWHAGERAAVVSGSLASEERPAVAQP